MSEPKIISRECCQCGNTFFLENCSPRKACSAECKLLWRRAYKKRWVSLDPHKERERQREADRRRKRRTDPEAIEARRTYMRNRYQKWSDLVSVLKSEMPDLTKEFGL